MHVRALMALLGAKVLYKAHKSLIRLSRALEGPLRALQWPKVPYKALKGLVWDLRAFIRPSTAL